MATRDSTGEPPAAPPIHLSPPDRGGLMPCCGRPTSDALLVAGEAFITENAAAVTCKGPPPPRPTWRWLTGLSADRCRRHLAWWAEVGWLEPVHVGARTGYRLASPLRGRGHD